MSQQTPHIIREFDQAMRGLADLVISMGAQARLNLSRAMEALLQRDLDRCKVVIADDTEVDEAERAVDAAGMDILLRFHPVASDLRLVISSMKIAANLERISDHAVNIAKRARKMLAKPEVREARLVEPVHLLADGQLQDALAAYADRDSEKGRGLKLRDQELDRAHQRVMSQLSQLLEEGGELSESYLHLLFVIRSLERVGDLAVNIGEDAVFLDRAEDIRHLKRRQELSEDGAN